ncbi:MCE family protein [Stackebrandtia nassauensis]|uniref:Virulence factor Mce family protein n=1 Tax=Stackebrandtia nassauensis (strain DSM 44728 / CIP 108903 / NRRL B-16338 / NBRC 102104 / LLR-40K-21) TaxID=446470 RepID=D3QB64_STANL|nr:MCE family protein [Stackebrandtia nassauensis]ADD40881.1 virulence factor Mce family protein [Stackebrandtia nassauensis DSM 44728]
MRRFMRNPVTVLFVVVVLAATAFFTWQALSNNGRHVTAEFTRAVGVYEGSDVRVLGVKVGEITSVQPKGKIVKVGLRIDEDYPIPDDAKAIVIPPSIVADRYVQLAPAYTGGARLEGGTTLGPDRTVVPLELDEVYESLDEFAGALGEDESLGEAIATAKKNLKGNGKDLGETLDNLGEVSEVLNEHSDDIWGTVDNLAEFTKMLAESDAEVEVFNEQLAEVSTQLSDERGTLSKALRELSVALADIGRFVDKNADKLTKSVEKLSDLSGVFARQQESLINILDYAPVALTNLDLAYNSRSGTMDTRDDLLGPYDPAGFLCANIATAVALEDVPAACFDLADSLAEGGAEMPKELKSLVGKGESILGDT